MIRHFTITRGDLKNIYRDRMQLLVAVTPLIIILLLRFLVPVVTNLLKVHLLFDLSPHYPFILSFFITLTPLFYGMVIGFLIIDERDEQLISYFAITPLTKSGYIKQRVGLPIVITFTLTIILVYGSGIVSIPFLNFLKLIPLAFMLALEAPLMAVVLASTASNKVEGLAIAKGMGITILSPLAGYFIAFRWRYLAGIFPQFWVSQAFLGIYNDHFQYLSSLSFGFLIHIIYLKLMINRFNKKVES